MSKNSRGVETQAIDPGALVLDCRPLASFLVDLPPGARQGMQSEQRGMPEVIAEIFGNEKIPGNNAGVASDVAELAVLHERICMLDERLVPARKLVEVLEESRAKLDDERHRLISAIAQVVETRARRLHDDALLARYEKTRAYRSAKAMKAVKTRKRNAGETADEIGEPTA